MIKAYTSNSLQKLVAKLMDKKRRMLQDIDKSSTFTASVSEDLNVLREENKLDIEDYMGKIEFINDTILRIKHAKNIFNTTYVMKKSNMTIDEAIVRIAMLNEQKSTLNSLNSYKSKERVLRSTSKEPEYTYTTYDKDYVREAYDRVFDEIQRIQEELNDINSTVTIEMNIDEEAINSL